MNFKIKKYLSIHTILLLAVMLVAVFFRFYNTPNRYGFDYDPTRDVLIVNYAASVLQFPLSGPPSGIGPFTFGPWYYYQLIFFKIIFPAAYSPWIYIGIISTISVFITHKIGLLLGGKKMGLLLAALAALSPAETGQIRALSNPTLIPLYTSLAIWMFIKFVKDNPPLWMSFLWGLILGVGINNHYQMLGLLPLPIILFIYKKDKRWIGISSFIAGMFIAFLPLLVFNFTHGWNTVKGVLFYVMQGAGGTHIPNRWLSYVGDFWPIFLSYVLGISSQWGLLTGLFMALLIAYLLIKKKMSITYVFLVVVFGINFLVLRFFPGQREYYYLLYLHPFIFILFGLSISYMFKFKLLKYFGFLMLLAVLIGMVSESIVRLAPATDQLQFKNEAKKIMSNSPNRKFVLYECQSSQGNRVRGVTFFLYNSGRISEDGVKIAYSNNKCPFPTDSNLSLEHLQGIEAIDISSISDQLLLKYGWKMVTPKSIFNQLSRGTL